MQSVKKLRLQRFRDDRGGKNKHFIWQNFGLCSVLPLDGLTGRWLDFRQQHAPVSSVCAAVSATS